jgi:hypothetical protein
MALDATTGSGPKPPKPPVSYGAPSGPYAAPIHNPPAGTGSSPSSPAAVLANQQAWAQLLGGGTSGGVAGGMQNLPSLQLPQAMNPLLTRYGLIHRKPGQQPIDDFYEQQGNLIRGGRPSDPTTMGFGDSLKFEAGLATMFPLGPGPEIGAASKAPRALSLLGDAWRSVRGEKNAARAVSYPTGDAPASKYALARLGQHAGFGPEVQAHRAAVEAPSIEEHLATLRALTSRHVGNMVNKQQGKVAGYKVPGIGTVKRGPDPMAGKHFDYTGQARPTDPEEMAQLIESQFGYDEGLEAFHDAPGFVHNIKDKFDNTIGSLTYDRLPPEAGVFGGGREARYDFGIDDFVPSALSKGSRIEAHEAYIRPEHRNMANLMRLVEPATRDNLPLEALIANPKLGRALEAMVKRGKLHPDSFFGGENANKGEKIRGQQGYEVPQSQLPELFRGFPRLIGSEGRSTTFRPSGSRTPSWSADWPMGFNPAR